MLKFKVMIEQPERFLSETIDVVMDLKVGQYTSYFCKVNSEVSATSRHYQGALEAVM